jgi:hypothetical protein
MAVFPLGRDLLAIYLQDHLAGSTLGVELARRAAAENTGTPLGTTLESLARDIASDRDALREIMSSLGIAPDRFKNALAWSAEKAGRLKLNGRITSHSPLSAVVELEGLIVGVSGKRALWRTLRGLADGDTRLQSAQLEELIARADRQLEVLWSAHEDVAPAALSREANIVGGRDFTG